jgi:DNA polymerase zeta
MDFQSLFSRIVKLPESQRVNRDNDEWGRKKQSNLACVGRIILNVWRIMRKCLNLTSYTLENIVFHVMHQRIPFFSDSQLTEWYNDGLLTRWRIIDYYLKRVQYPLILLQKTEQIDQTTEFARVFGCDFYSALVRGSQFKVECVMSRITRPENFIMVSPRKEDVANMRAFESIALNMEPHSQLYTSPVSVLDFQSLYPSICIGYNYCYSTCLGSLSGLENGCGLGVLQSFQVKSEILASLNNHIQISPNGVVFLKSHVRKGVLGRMLTEILETRIMIKKSMKIHAKDKRLLRILDAKQKGLKLLANVTYGYVFVLFYL